MDASGSAGNHPSRPEPRSIVLRTHRPGDIGHITSRHGILYHEQFGWSVKFEAVVARIFADFVDNYDESTERLWVAEDATTGAFLGSILLVRDRDLPNTAKLRTLLVEPGARGTGLGGRLVRECLEFAKNAGYQRVGLWTQSFLDGAKRLYKAAGFQLVKEEKHASFGIPMVGEFWELQFES
jgi:GNAT superfamily N-acetyltransferase